MWHVPLKTISSPEGQGLQGHVWVAEKILNHLFILSMDRLWFRPLVVDTKPDSANTHVKRVELRSLKAVLAADTFLSEI